MADGGTGGPSAAEMELLQKDLGIDKPVDKPKRPGSALKKEPVSINGIDYDPLHPPKMYTNADGNVEFRGGKELANNKSKETSETGKEKSEIDNRVKVAAKYLERLDNYAEFVNVNPATGAIEYIKPQLPDITDPEVLDYQKNFTNLIRNFDARNKVYQQILTQTEGVLDVKNIMGALVVTYDSSIAVPNIQDLFLNKEEDPRGQFSDTTEKYLGVVVVDLNQPKRADGVTPTTSTAHELRHFSLSMTDYLLTQDQALNIQSAYRKGRSTALFGASKDRILTNQAFLNDSSIYSQLLGREFDLNIDLPNVKKQLNYLDELHSSYLQRKPGWFNAQENVYALGNKGKHWELVGGNPQDIEASKNLLGYLQGFYSLDLIRRNWKGKLATDPNSLGDGQKQFIGDTEKVYLEIGSIVGVARTIDQAQRLVQQKWIEFISKYPKILTTPEFGKLMKDWEKGAGMEGLRQKLLQILPSK